jgi:integrase
MREAQAYLTRKLRERDLGRDLEGAKITLNEYLDRWLKTSVRPRVRPNTFQDYQGALHRHVRPVLGEQILAALQPLDLQAMYQHMTERGLSARTIRYAHVLMKVRCSRPCGGACCLRPGRWTQSTATSSKRNAVSDP